MIDELKTSKEVNRVALLILASCFDDFAHNDPLQEYIYRDLDKESVENLLKKILFEYREIDWKGDLDIKSQPTTIAEWDSLFRSFSRLFHRNNVLDILSFSIKKAKSHNIKLDNKLHPLLKARLLYQISLNDYLDVFCDKDFDFIFASVFSKNLPKYSRNDKAISIIESELSNYSLDAMKFEVLVGEIFIDYYYQSLEEDEEKLRIVKTIATKIADKIKADSYLPSLKFKDYIIYPRILRLYSEDEIQITDQQVSDHVVKTFLKTLNANYSFIVSEYSFGFPHESLSNEMQESYAYIMHSFFQCSDELFSQLEKKLKRYAYSILPNFFGRFYADKLAVTATTNLYLLLFSITWLTEDITAYKNRFDVLFKILSDSLLEPYSYRLAEHLKNYSKNLSFLDERAAFFFMMEQIKENNKFNIHTSISEFIENVIPLNWPWSGEVYVSE